MTNDLIRLKKFRINLTMKIIKISLLIIWGFVTIGLLTLSLVQRQDALNYKYKLEEVCKKDHGNCSKILNEYSRNMQLLKNDSLKKIDIDSLYRNSEFLNK